MLDYRLHYARMATEDRLEETARQRAALRGTVRRVYRLARAPRGGRSAERR